MTLPLSSHGEPNKEEVQDNPKPLVTIPDSMEKGSLKPCNVVMKGGITSGIVYPPAILQLAQAYRFECIGGTSAGAIAAALTAAAEYGRESGGFTRLAEASNSLKAEGFLRSLFQPTPAARPLFEALLRVMKKRGSQRQPKSFLRSLFSTLAILAGKCLRFRPQFFIMGSLVGGLVFWLFAWSVAGHWRITAVLPLLLLILFGGTAASCYYLYSVLTKQLTNFGICSGEAVSSSMDSEVQAPFTDWLAERIDHIAGAETPLTFAMLKERQITLAMFSSNLSQERPYLLPFETNLFIFNEEEMRELFPDSVVEHLKLKTHQGSLKLPEGYHYLPEGDELPVVVAMRLSLSFPLLISAIPLHTVSATGFQKSRKGQEILPSDLQPNWFSDGGVCSNFPIHLFENWFPHCPTFGINLTAWPKEALDDKGSLKPQYLSEEETAQTQNNPVPVFMRQANKPSQEEWHEIEDLKAFLGAIWSTAQNYRDRMQAQLPSYRERIVNIRLANNEGGLNLDMPATTIERISHLGEEAGATIADKFSLPHHQWTRMRVVLAQLEHELAGLYPELEQLKTTIEELIALQAQPASDGEPKFPYRTDDAKWCDDTAERLDALYQFIEAWGSKEHFDYQAPKPEPIMRLSPRI